MVKTLTQHGHSLALIIEKPILELLKIMPDTFLEISTDGRNLIISPIKHPSREKKMKSALEKVNRRHASTLRKLAQ